MELVVTPLASGRDSLNSAGVPVDAAESAARLATLGIPDVGLDAVAVLELGSGLDALLRILFNAVWPFCAERCLSASRRIA